MNKTTSLDVAMKNYSKKWSTDINNPDYYLYWLENDIVLRLNEGEGMKKTIKPKLQEAFPNMSWRQINKQLKSNKTEKDIKSSIKRLWGFLSDKQKKYLVLLHSEDEMEGGDPATILYWGSVAVLIVTGVAAAVVLTPIITYILVKNGWKLTGDFAKTVKTSIKNVLEKRSLKNEIHLAIVKKIGPRRKAISKKQYDIRYAYELTIRSVALHIDTLDDKMQDLKKLKEQSEKALEKIKDEDSKNKDSTNDTNDKDDYRFDYNVKAIDEYISRLEKDIADLNKNKKAIEKDFSKLRKIDLPSEEEIDNSIKKHSDKLEI
jgi:hypothetical protein